MNCWSPDSHGYVTGQNVKCSRCVYCGEHKLVTAVRSFFKKGL